MQWQWQANPVASWYSLSERPGWLRLRSQPLPQGAVNLWPAPAVLLQKFPAPRFSATTSIDVTGLLDGEIAGLVVMGLDYAFIGVRRVGSRTELVDTRVHDADKETPERINSGATVSGVVQLRVHVGDPAICQFEWSADGRTFSPVGESFPARVGKWISAKVGLFAVAPVASTRHGHADFDYLRIINEP
ncbi:MAG: hypothetical protein ABI442_09885 [Gemmatimonadaceae bacterium]